MKTLYAVAAIVVLAGVAVAGAVGAFGADAPGRPPGVSASDWAAISDTVGIVLVDQRTAAGDAPIMTPTVPQASAAVRVPVMASGGATLIAPVTGYLMVKRGNIWQRLIVIEPVKGPGVAG